MHKHLIKVNSSDNVAVALLDLTTGQKISFEEQEITVESFTKAKHKIALSSFEVGDKIIMYGVLVGKASQPIKRGGLLTTENVKHESSKVLVKPKPYIGRLPMLTNGKTEHSRVIIGKMVKLEQKMFGCFSL